MQRTLVLFKLDKHFLLGRAQKFVMLEGRYNAKCGAARYKNIQVLFTNLENSPKTIAELIPDPNQIIYVGSLAKRKCEENFDCFVSLELTNYILTGYPPAHTNNKLVEMGRVFLIATKAVWYLIKYAEELFRDAKYIEFRQSIRILLSLNEKPIFDTDGNQKLVHISDSYLNHAILNKPKNITAVTYFLVLSGYTSCSIPNKLTNKGVPILLFPTI